MKVQNRNKSEYVIIGMPSFLMNGGLFRPSEEGNIIAGYLAVMYCWKVIYLDVLWVGEQYRRFGLGSKLLKNLEEIAKEKGCTLIHLDTFDFQAKDFYIRHGYELFGTLEDCPKGHYRYYLKKKL